MVTNEELIQEMQRFNALSRRSGQEKGQHRYGKLANGDCDHEHEAGHGENAEHGTGEGKAMRHGQNNGAGMGQGKGRGQGAGGQGQGRGQGAAGQGKGMGQRRGNGMRGANRGAGQNRVLSALKGEDGITQKDLAQKLSIRPQTLSESLVKLEQDKLVERQQDEGDKRIVHVYLTEEGKDEALSACEDQKSHADDIFNALTDEERNQLSAILTKLNAKMEAPVQTLNEETPQE